MGKGRAHALGIIILLVLALIGAYRVFLWAQYASKEHAIAPAERGKFDRDLLYRSQGGAPLVLVDPAYTRTLFFIEGFRAQMPAGMYADWLRDLHRATRTNIIVPVYGLQSSPFAMRNRQWFFQEDMRTVLQIYDAYTALLPAGHRVVTCSMSFGTLPHLTIAAHAKHPPDAIVLLSPLNTGMEYKVMGKLVYWLSKQTAWLQHVLLFSTVTAPPNRASVWDIVNRQENLRIAAQFPVNPEDNVRLGHQVEQAAAWMERELVPQVKGRDITVVWGDSDLFFSQAGFRTLAVRLHTAGNRVQTVTVRNSGHMVLMDNGAAQVKALITRRLEAPPDSTPH